MSYEKWRGVYVEKPQSLEGWKRNSHSKETGALKQSLNFKNDPTFEKRDKIANDFYEKIRQNKSTFIKEVSKNANISEKNAEEIFNHVFIKEHQLRDGFKRFFPDYYMAESFRRIIENDAICSHDLILLKHEKLECYLMKRYGYGYDKAHNITERKYNYRVALEKWLKETGDW